MEKEQEQGKSGNPTENSTSPPPPSSSPTAPESFVQFDPDGSLDPGLLALLLHELNASLLPETAKALLQETGLSQARLSGGLPPRLKDLVDLWNGFQDEMLNGEKKPKPSSTDPVRKKSPPPIRLDRHSVVSSAAAAAAASQSLGDHAEGFTSHLDSHQGMGQSELSSILHESDFTGGEDFPPPPPPRKKDVRPATAFPGVAFAAAAPQNHRHGPWLVEEEDLLRHALFLFPGEKLEDITRVVETRSVTGVTKHLTKVNRGWGQATNDKLCEVLRSPSATFARLLAAKPNERTEKELISWLEWFIFLNARANPALLAQFQLQAEEDKVTETVWSGRERAALHQLLAEEVEVELLDRFATRFPDPVVVEECRKIEIELPGRSGGGAAAAVVGGKRRKSKKTVQGRWSIEEAEAFDKVFAEAPRNFRALCEAVPLRSRESVALRIRKVNGDPNPRKKSNIVADTMVDVEEDRAEGAAEAGGGAAGDQSLGEHELDLPNDYYV